MEKTWITRFLCRMGERLMLQISALYLGVQIALFLVDAMAPSSTKLVVPANNRDSQPKMFISFKELFSRYSTWVVTILMGAAAYWLTLPVEEQAALKAAYPILVHFAPLAGLLVFLGARAKVQGPKE